MTSHYLPLSGVCPTISEMLDKEKSKELIEEIEKAEGITEEERQFLKDAAGRHKKYMDEVNAEYDAWEKKFKEDTGIEEPRDDPSVTWKIYNSYYEAYRKGEIA